MAGRAQLSPPFADRELDGLNAAEAVVRLEHLAANRIAGQRALAALLVRWAGKLKSDADVAALATHLERLALVFALSAACRRADERRGGAR